MLRVLASIGTELAAFTHELNGLWKWLPDWCVILGICVRHEGYLRIKGSSYVIYWKAHKRCGES